MDETEAERVALAAGLQAALSEFRADLLTAAKAAEDLRRAVRTPLDPLDEPWPPMRADAP